jgi:hypothetical protein
MAGGFALCPGRAGSDVRDTTAPRRLPSIAKPAVVYELKGRKTVSLLVALSATSQIHSYDLDRDANRLNRHHSPSF